MTKVSVFGQETEKKEKKVSFIYLLNPTGLIQSINYSQKPENYDNVQLYRKSYHGADYDLILAWNENGTNRDIYLGHWNDGVVK